MQPITWSTSGDDNREFVLVTKQPENANAPSAWDERLDVDIAFVSRTRSVT
jgi:hypothetical protein